MGFHMSESSRTRRKHDTQLIFESTLLSDQPFLAMIRCSGSYFHFSIQILVFISTGTEPVVLVIRNIVRDTFPQTLLLKTPGAANTPMLPPFEIELAECGLIFWPTSNCPLGASFQPCCCSKTSAATLLLLLQSFLYCNQRCQQHHRTYAPHAAITLKLLNYWCCKNSVDITNKPKQPFYGGDRTGSFLFLNPCSVCSTYLLLTPFVQICHQLFTEQAANHADHTTPQLDHEPTHKYKTGLSPCSYLLLTDIVDERGLLDCFDGNSSIPLGVSVFGPPLFIYVLCTRGLLPLHTLCALQSAFIIDSTSSFLHHLLPEHDSLGTDHLLVETSPSLTSNTLSPL
ncbi:hypothetical protein Salat_1369200 [Sesamum alatum]|uniref:Uncharacterized protein n=1 Tax=Sesamum alatum TaxID=300844 RepID=A0AAE1Y9K0_9LAMI|nr:hypothetical protein Salat_1369200 [Sesamum alatum]